MIIFQYIMQQQLLACSGSEIRLKFGNISVFIHKKNRKVFVRIETCMPKYLFGPVEKIWVFTQSHHLVTLGFIQFMKKIVGFNSTHPPITQIRVHSGLKKTNSTYPKPPKKGRIPAVMAAHSGEYAPWTASVWTASRKSSTKSTVPNQPDTEIAHARYA